MPSKVILVNFSKLIIAEIWLWYIPISIVVWSKGGKSTFLSDFHCGGRPGGRMRNFNLLNSLESNAAERHPWHETRNSKAYGLFGTVV